MLFRSVDVATGRLHDYDGFLRNFFACYHPLNNGNQLVIHPQPAGLAVTDSSARFVGWHAITILRVALDHSGEMGFISITRTMTVGKTGAMASRSQPRTMGSAMASPRCRSISWPPGCIFFTTTRSHPMLSGVWQRKNCKTSKKWPLPAGLLTV